MKFNFLSAQANNTDRNIYDFIVEDNTPFFLEINTIPGMTDQSIFPKQVVLNNFNLKDLFTEIIENSIK